MHRSGTSLLASALVSAGIDMGERLLPGDARNPPGYFEDLDFLDLDRRMLTAACPPKDGGHPDWGWTESERFNPDSFANHRDEARALLAARVARDQPWGFKDPRAALLLDFWLSLAPEARFILPYRLPWEVADSIQRLGADLFLRRPDYGYRIWAFYNRHLLDFHRRHAERTMLVSVDAAVTAGPRFAELLRKKLGLDAPPDALAARLEPGLLRRFPPDDPLIPLAGAAYPECLELLDSLDAESELPATGLWHRESPRPRRFAGESQLAVVIPCFDHGDFVIEAVASVERSLTVPYELIVVDDGSREPQTRTVLDLLREAGYEVHRRPHRGVAAARNHGFAAARAPFVIPLDSDNQLLPGFVEKALATLREDPRLAAVYGDRLEFGLRTGRVEVGEFDPDLLIAGNYVDACAVIRRQAWENCGGYDEGMPAQGLEDWELWVAVIGRGWTLRWLPLAAFAYRVRPDSMLRQLESSSHADLEEYLVAKHHTLYVTSLSRTIWELRGARQELGRTRAELDERSGALAETQAVLVQSQAVLGESQAELAASRADLGRVASALDDAQRAVEDVELAYRQEAERARRLDEERDALERQRRFLHGHLQVWRERLNALESTRSSRLRSYLLRLRSRIERRARMGPAEPCVVGATGGSGTRIFARLAERGGLYIGTDRNEFEDALPIERFRDRGLVPFWTGGGYEPPHLSPPGMDDDFLATLGEQFSAYDFSAGGPRGWKCPQSLYVLPYLAQRFPDLRFLHVVRDGRDVALSANQFQLARYGTTLLSPAEQEWSEAERSIALWSRINGLAAERGERLGGAYLRVRFEDLCARPVAVTRRVFRFFGLPGDPRKAARMVETPASMGRWRHADPELVARLEEIGGGVLRRFGYAAADSRAAPGPGNA
jgi:cellulose synthase/poly-beta-1,6-N-acetylglucosamine synthase-like glycosyltransferase